MNYADLQGHCKDLLRQWYQQEFITAAAVNLAKIQLQMAADFRCMETHTAPITYSASDTTGVALPTTTKYVTAVWELDPATQARICPFQPTSEGEARRILLATQGDASEYGQRWWEQERKLRLLWPPTGTSTVLISADLYQILPDYNSPTATDYFSERLPLLLIYGAAKIIAEGLPVDQQGAGVVAFANGYANLLLEALANDRTFKKAGLAKSYSPALPGTKIRGGSFAG